MILRWLATLGIAALLVLDFVLPSTSIGRRGTEALARIDVEGVTVATGDLLPEFELVDLDGRLIDWQALRGQRVLITFERSVDW